MKSGVLATSEKSAEQAVSRPDLAQVTHEIVAEKFPSHPFLSQVNAENVRDVMADYAAMSQLFPYVQAKAIGDAALNSLLIRNQIASAIDQTSVVGAFLVSDEFGVHHLACSEGNPGLPKILDTKDNFHFQMLLRDTARLFGNEIKPNYSELTMSYMNNLLKILSSDDDVVRAAAMAAFEAHAENMITALWSSLVEIFPDVPKESLDYFRIHVGGDDPAEQYHVAMTAKMLNAVVPDDACGKFSQEFTNAYQLNTDWCAAITRTSKH